MKKQVTKEEFDKFINDYPNNLTFNINYICEPPCESYYDLSASNRADKNSLVAFIILKEVFREPNEYFITIK